MDKLLQVKPSSELKEVVPTVNEMKKILQDEVNFKCQQLYILEEIDNYFTLGIKKPLRLSTRNLTDHCVDCIKTAFEDKDYTVDTSGKDLIHITPN